MRKYLFTIILLAAVGALLTSCATTSPNEALIVGKWNPVTVEKILPEKAAAQGQGTTTATPGGTAASGNDQPQARKEGKGGGSGENYAKAEEKFNRLYRAEQKATLEIYADKSAVKNFGGTMVKATWKMKPNGKKVIAKNVKTKEKYVLEILELSETQAVIQENLPMGALKITYAKEK
jgi:hypothetical protein